MATDPSLTDNLLAFFSALETHWIALAIGVLLVIEGLFSPFRQDRPPEGRRVVMVAAAGLAFLVASFQAFSDQQLAAQHALKSAESFRDAMQTNRDRGSTERDNLAAQVSALEKQLAESQKQLAEVQIEDGTQRHPFSDKAKCPPGFAIVDSNQATGSSAAATGRQRLCFVALKPSDATTGAGK